MTADETRASIFVSTDRISTALLLKTLAQRRGEAALCFPSMGPGGSTHEEPVIPPERSPTPLAEGGKEPQVIKNIHTLEP